MTHSTSLVDPGYKGRSYRLYKRWRVHIFVSIVDTVMIQLMTAYDQERYPSTNAETRSLTRRGFRTILVHATPMLS